MSYRREEILPHDICNTKGVLHMEPSHKDKAGRHQQLLEKVHERGGVFISGTYEISTSVYRIKCAHGHEWDPQWNIVVQKGSWCRICTSKGRKPRKGSLEDCIELAAAKGGLCLSETFVSTTSPMIWKCGDPTHKPWKTRMSHIREGSWCRPCSKEIAAAKTRNTIEEAREIAIGRGGLCLSTVYGRRGQKMLWKCGKCNIELYSEFADIKRGYWCGPCGRKQGWEKHKHTLEEVRQEGAKRNYTLVSTSYISSGKHLKWLCPQQHPCTMSHQKIKRGNNCSICCESKQEGKVRLTLEAEGIVYEKEWGLKGTRYRFDFFVPSLNLIIECDGAYHFQQRGENREQFRKQLQRDEYKDKYAEDNKISLFRISYFDKEHTMEEWTRIAINLVQEAGYYHISPYREYKNQLLAALQ
jgi:hypothetical protein